MLRTAVDRPGNNAAIVKAEMIHPRVIVNLARAKGQTIDVVLTSATGLGIVAPGASETLNGKLVGMQDDYLCLEIEAVKMGRQRDLFGDGAVIRHWFPFFGDQDVIGSVSIGTEKIYDRDKDITTREALLEERKMNGRKVDLGYLKRKAAA